LHECADVLDKDYHPSDAEEEELFTKKKQFMYTVFQKKLQTDYGQHLVREH
jgi:hypothetical protein